MNHLLLVEDDDRLSQLIADFLQGNQMRVTRLRDGRNLLKNLQQQRFDLLLLDVMLPGEDGFALCQKVRQQLPQQVIPPIIFMTAKGDSYDQVLGLQLGADDYVVKPVEPRVLLARIQALLRRTQQQRDALSNIGNNDNSHQNLCFGQLQIDQRARRVTLANQAIDLTSHEFDMLCLLAQNASQLVTRDTLYQELIGREYDGLDRSADVRISRLRKKLQDNPKAPFRIKTIWGKGFYFVADAWE